jgi:endonuclease YncB( thermonuclease family)
VRLPLVLLLLLLPLTSWSAELSGRVVRVSDGDTLVLLDTSNTQHKIRLAGIDCPERGQPFGQRAKQALSDYAFSRQVTVEWDKLDRYGRTVGKIVDGEKDVNLALVRDGMCWWYRKYAHSRAKWIGSSTRPQRPRRRSSGQDCGSIRRR